MSERDRPRDRLGRPLPPGSADQLGRSPEPRNVEEALLRAIEAFDEQRFFEAHEHFEWIWKSPGTPTGDREFWKGVTQIAVACCHVQRGNMVGARSLLRRGIERLRHYPTLHAGIETKKLITAAKELGPAALR